MEIAYNYFRIAVNTKYENVVVCLEKIFGKLESYLNSKRVFLITDRYLEIIENEYYDAWMADFDEDYWYYYRYNIEIFSRNDKPTLEEQINLSKKIKEEFINYGIKQVEIIAEFEHLLCENHKK